MASKKGLTIKIAPDEIMHTSISKSKNGYNSARVLSKINDKVYMSVSVEWEGDEPIPGFALDLMETLRASEIKVNVVVEGFESEVSGFKERNE